MLAFSELNPITIFLYYVCVVALCMFCMNPVTALISLCGAIGLWLVKYGKKDCRFHIFAAAMFLIVAVLNPIFSHNGKTVLFVMNNAPVTLEALFFGTVMSSMLVSSLYWLKSFSAMMTSDRLLYVFGKTAPKTALILSMAFRMIPMFISQAKKTEAAQKAMGLYKDDSLIGRFKGKAKVFSVMLTWVTENAIVTADSMGARGYTGGKRTSYSLWHFSVSDVIYLCLLPVLCAPAVVSLAGSGLEFVFYPTVIPPEISVLTVSAYVFFAVLCFIPFISEAGDKLKWKYLQSKI